MVVTRQLVLLLLTACILPLAAKAAVLPEDRIDVLYHNYDGGGMEIDGPSVIVRKSIAQSFSLSANYYVDTISSASIDVELSASPYREERTEKSVGLDYLHEKTSISTGYTRSSENDFDARSMRFDISQDFFGDMTTVALGYSRGWDTVGNAEDASFKEEVDRQHYRLSLTQIMTKSMIASFSWEAITDEGFLNNPYRSVRYCMPDAANCSSFSLEPEHYPNTRTSNAAAIRARYFLPYRAAVYAEYKSFSDSWEIEANTYEIGYTHPIEGGWIVDIKYRRYDQTDAEFYQDLFPREQATSFRARDKELSKFGSETIGLGLSYEFRLGSLGFIDRGTINLQIDYMDFAYDNFRDATAQGYRPGEEPLYGYSAVVSRFFFSIWY